jgi:single-strand DNA-binding protein
MDPYIWMQGNLVADPTQRVVASGHKVTKFRIAASGRRFDKAVGDWVNTDTVYMSVSCWRQLGDNVAKSLRKGDTVVVHGRLTFREYDDAHGGPRRHSYEIDASSVAPDLSRYVAQLGRPVRELPVPEPAEPGPEATGLPTQPVDDPWSVPIPAVAGAAEDTAA